MGSALSYISFPYIILLLINGFILFFNTINPILSLTIFLIFLLVALSIKNIFFALCLWILCHTQIFNSTQSIEPGEIMFLFLTLLIFVSWLYKSYINKKIIFNNFSDYSLGIFFILLLLSLIPALLYQNDLFKWCRELFPLFSYLFYFIFKDEMVSNERRNIILSCFLFLVLYSGIQNIINYQNLISNLSYVWEIQGSRQAANEPLFFFTLIISTSFFMFLKSKLHRLTCIFLIFFSTASLLITFSRGYWVATFLALLILFSIFDNKRKINMLANIASMVAPFLILVYYYLGDLSVLFYDIFLSRFMTISDVFNDISFVNRLEEAKKVFSLYIMNPFMGYGLGATYSFHNIILEKSVETWYIHNAFLYILYKIGFFGLISFLLFYYSIIKTAYKNYISQYDNFNFSISLGTFCCFLGMIPLSFTSPQYIQSNSILFIILTSAMMENISSNKIGLK